MIRRTAKWVILTPLGVLILLFAIANRQVVTFTLDPLGVTHSALAFSLPLFALVFVLVILGVIVGGIAAWLRQGKWRRRVRELDLEARALRAENNQLRRRFEAGETKAALRPPAA